MSRKGPSAKRRPEPRRQLPASLPVPEEGRFHLELPPEAAQWLAPARTPSAERPRTEPPAPAPARPVAASQDPQPPSGRVEAYLGRLAPEVVGMTYWFDPGPAPARSPVTIRFTGQRAGARPPWGPGEHFVHDQVLEGVVGGSGPVAVTMKIRDVVAGEWTVDAAMLPGEGSGGGPGTIAPVFPARWSWLRWRLSAAPVTTVTTRLAPLVRPPAVLVGSWAAMVFLGIIFGLLTQSLVLSAQGLQLSRTLAVSLAAVLGGAVGAKVWFIVLHRKDRTRDGWCVQGVIAGIVVVAPALLAVFRVPIGVFLDATAPGLLIGLATGRIGCFFTGCCAGRPTGSRFAVWSSNRTVGSRRIPTQLLESFLAFTVAAAVLLAVLVGGPRRGTLFIAALALYTLIRQGLLLLREERRQSQRGPTIVAVVSAFVLAADVAATVLIG